MIELLVVILFLSSFYISSLFFNIIDHIPSIYDVILFIPSIIATLSYLILTLKEYKYSPKEYILYILLFIITNIAFFTLMINIRIDNLLYIYLGQFFISLSIAFSHYTNKNIEPSN